MIDETINEFQIVDFSKATIREVKAIASKAEAVSGVEFIKMEMGVPGLPASAVGVKAEIEALQNGIASLYPDINGLPELKKEASNFIKAFINVDLSPEGCVPVTGSMQGTFASFLTCSQCAEKKDTILFIDPGFPVQKQQLVVMGQKYETFDVYDYRGDKLKEKLEKLQNFQSLMKKVNAYYRKNGTMKGFEGISDEKAAEIDEAVKNSYSWITAPYAPYELSNNNAEINRLKKRIAALESRAEVGFVGWQFEGGEAVANEEENRLQLLFDEKPSEEQRSKLKSWGFRWSPSNKAWQRQLNDHAIYAAGQIDFIKPLDGRTPREIQPKPKHKDEQER